MEDHRPQEGSRSTSSSHISRIAKRLRHQCIAISHPSIPSLNTLSSAPLPDSLSPSCKVDGKSRSRSISALSAAGDCALAEKTLLLSLEAQATPNLQRSASLHDFSEYALPGNLAGPPSPMPTPKSPKRTQFITRRSSSIQGEVFTSNELEFGRTLGTGFFGKAIQVKHKRTGVYMVVKQLLTCDEDAKKSFLKEAAILKALNHPKLVKYIGFLYNDKKELHIVMEYIPGGTLEQRLQSLENIELMKKLSFSIDIASAMEYLHSQQVIHRDLNSPNCLLREDGSAVVADFGLSKLVQESIGYSKNSLPKVKTKKKRHTVVGNPYWMAPEMLKGEQYDERVDVFSFGIIMCEIIGQVKADPDYLPRLANFALDEALFFKKFGSCCPQEFCEYAFSCCQVLPEDRPSFQKIHQDLIKFYKFYTVAERRLSRHPDIHTKISKSISSCT